jgi:hypothetical protein
MIFRRTSHSNNELAKGNDMALPFSHRASAAALVLLGSLPAVLVADPPAAGDLWQVTSKVSMEGLPMELPAQTAQVCSAKVWTRPPAGENPQQKCERTEYVVTGNKVTWTETCHSPPMTGKGEIIRQGNDAYTGSIKFVSEQGNMTINLTGHKVGGCDHPT